MSRSTTLRLSILATLAVVGLCLSSSMATAAVITYYTPVGSTIGGEPVNAKATFTTSADTITVKIDNLQNDPNSVKQVVYDVLFTVSTGQNSGTITSISGTERTIAGGGTYSDVAFAGTPDWDLNTSGSQLHLDRLTYPGQKEHGVIGGPNGGSGEYDNANASITGATHNPFLASGAIFTLNVPGVTAASTITAATLSFNTEAGYNVVAVPEPGMLALATISSLLAAGVVLRRRRQPR